MSQGVDRLVEVGRGVIGGKGIESAQREGMAFTISNEGLGNPAALAIRDAGFAGVFLESDPGKGKAATHIGTKGDALIPETIGILHAFMGDQLVEKSRRDQAVNLAHGLARETPSHGPLQFQALLQHLRGIDIEFEVDGFRGDVELVEEVDQCPAIGILNNAFQGTHAQVFQRGSMFATHGFEMIGQHRGNGLEGVIGAKGADAHDFF